MAALATKSAPTLETSDSTLEANLLTILQSSALPPNEAQAVETCILDLKAVFCSDLWGRLPWRFAAFGSAVNGFSSKGCDIDIVAYQDVPAGGSKIDARVILRKLEQSFNDSSAFVIREAVLQARVRIPILKLRYGDCDVDLSVNNIGPLPNTRLLRAYAGLDKCVADLGIAVKLWAKAAGLCGAPSGHLSSYAVLMMVLYFLQIVAGLPCLQACGDSCFDDDEGAETALAGALVDGAVVRQSLAQLFRGFFDFYDSDFRWGSEVVSVRLGHRQDRSDAKFGSLRKRQERRLHIEDPFDCERNLGDVLWDGREDELRDGLHTTHLALKSGKLTDVLVDFFDGKAPRAKTKSKAQVGSRWSDTVWGNSNKQGQGHMLPRTRITSLPIRGRVLEWKGKYGWLEADDPIDHEKHRQDGRIFLSMTDVRDPLELPRLRPVKSTSSSRSAAVQFHLFFDESGIGAEECALVE